MALTQALHLENQVKWRWSSPPGTSRRLQLTLGTHEFEPAHTQDDSFFPFCFLAYKWV
jgi:hypothetical protein